MRSFNLIIFVLFATIFITLPSQDVSAKKFKLKRTSWISEKPLIDGKYYVEFYFYKDGDFSMVIEYTDQKRVKNSTASYEVNDSILVLNLKPKILVFKIKWIDESRIELTGESGDSVFFTKGLQEEKCRVCNGGGGCSICHGSGENRSNYGISHMCQTCIGTGNCYHCKGKGYIKL